LASLISPVSLLVSFLFGQIHYNWMAADHNHFAPALPAGHTLAHAWGLLESDGRLTVRADAFILLHLLTS
jgi:hypothetical protein